ncbi:4-deoxy-4-formamido-L-arabinose-phosphoundecaprenol deformylase [Enterobacter sp. DTU_2021_1002640_1_SI_PRY_ASU_LCPMC_013]|uniref:4-deoxy-4-formamido-L-arabinose- phosphoundecaprenol deformylase n=1 Tax=Enterobacter sp. DTU_2021_1002640_1_SI_PRY_ASU_LCPMC_013 TaxID=3077940 RepID=UPI0028EF57D5|nr:4-deoxy-4-formamido-L-arabinose-phosphoundecaprenol deformylase [Enterobacter sp. DTU_2021_1002640_1_SI_PRY_ASU_LCPMC_013]WNU99075.1 4-deoxy-4-formamido-L-arabinose-phosphoundecaprenol deformylase [Enterobacter sp. DTU_2021_1002640_1_SI_PRY_ASU_LCPMC_013]
MRKVGLRIDVDTWRGTRYGMPRLLDILRKHDIRASVFFSVGPDNMGRHLWRLLKPAFLMKMLRSRAASLYGWDILLAGTAWPGRIIGAGNAGIIRETARDHEIGLHAWDHFSWQAFAGVWGEARLYDEISRGKQALEAIINQPVTCSAAAGWRADSRIIRIKESFGFRYNSDCRGSSPFRPCLSDGTTGTVQIPVTLPTWDEVVGRNINAMDFNRYLMDLIQMEDKTHVYTIHAEVEGITIAERFDALLVEAEKEGIQFCSLGELLPRDSQTLSTGKVIRSEQPGREGWLGYQTEGSS